MTLDDLDKVLEEVDDKDQIRKYELIILEKMGWKFNNISALESSRMLMRKYFEMQGQEFDLDSVQGYLQGFLLACSFDKEFLKFSYFEQGIIATIAFLDLTELSEEKKGYIKWLHKIVLFDPVRIYF